MSTIDRLLIGCILVTGLLFGGFVYIKHYGAEQYAAGQAAAVAAGKIDLAKETESNRKREDELRNQLATKDANAHEKALEYAAKLDDAQRRMRAGIDSLRCPALSIPSSTEAENRFPAGGLEVEPAGPTLMPEVASDILGIAADIAGLLRRYERLEERYDACAEMNNK